MSTPPIETQQASRELLGALFEGARRGAALISDDGRLLLANEQFLTAAGGEPVPGETADSWLRRVFGREPAHPEMLSGPSGVFRETRKRLGSGETLVWLDESPPERREAERRSAYLSIASHDVRGPLANTRSYASLLLSPKMELNERAQHCADVIRRNADRALGLLQEFFDACLDEFGALDLDLSPQDPGAMIHERLSKARSLAAEKGIPLVADIPPSFPVASLDRNRLSHAIGAFLEHAIARSSGGQPVKLEARIDAGGLFVAVTDSGGPMPASSALFDLQERTVAQGKLAEGFRLGLAKAEILAHGGQVGSRAGNEGLALFFTLPLNQC